MGRPCVTRMERPMKVLPTARILIVDPQMERRQATRAGLAALGVGALTEAASLDKTEHPLSEGHMDVIVVQADDLNQVPENPFRQCGGVPAILVAEGTPSVLTRAATMGGYDAAVGMPVLPRLLYRRIGSVLQRARRNNRPQVAAPAAKGADMTSAG